LRKEPISLVALAALAATGAFAQVTLSGNLSTGVSNTNGVKAVNGSDVYSSNSVKFTSTEDLGGGMKATGVFDMRITNTGADRNTGDLYIDLSGAFGSVRAGQFTFASNSGFNPFASRTATSLATGGGAVGPSGVQYTTPSFSGMTVSVFAGGQTEAAGTTAATGVKLNYANGPLAAQVASSSAGMLQANVDAGDVASTVTSAGLSYDAGVAKIYVNSSQQKAGTGSSTGSTAMAEGSGTAFGVAVPMGALTVKAGMMNYSTSSTATSVSKLVDRNSVGVDYALSKRTTFQAEMGKQKEAKAGANAQTNYWVGINHTF
jgi:hypothetical protein